MSIIRTAKGPSGTYGTIILGKTNDLIPRSVAVKRNITDESVDFSGSLKEMDLLNRLKGHPYIVKLLSVSLGNPFNVPHSPISRSGSFNYHEDYLHFIFEQASANGHSLIYSENVHVSYLKIAIVQMFLGMEYMHAKRIIHRDLKPANLLWFVSNDNKAAMKICDFGLSKIHTTKTPMTPKVVTCWYRAPEICSKDPHYSYASDVWSGGCILFEMVAKKALLQSMADDDRKLLSKIIGLMPNPSYEDIFKLTKGHKIKLTAEASPRHRPSFRELINLSTEKIEEFNQYPVDGAKYDTFLNLIEKILVLDWEKRLSATEVLNHSFFDPYRDLIDSIRKEYPPTFSFGDEKINIVNCKERRWISDIVTLVFNSREHFGWYKHQILFQSLDIFDRYLTYIRTKTTKRLTESNLNGRYLTKYQTELHYIVCLYMSIKYFTTLKLPISFGELASDNYKTEKAMIEAEEFEKRMVSEILEYSIYRDTVYEKAEEMNNSILSEYQIRDLLKEYIGIDCDIYLPLTKLTEMFFPLSFVNETDQK